MSGKIILLLLLFILFYHKEVKSKKLLKNDEMFADEDLIIYESDAPYDRVKRDVTLEEGSGTVEPFTTLSSRPTTTFVTSQTSTTDVTSTSTTQQTSQTTTQNTRIISSSFSATSSLQTSSTSIFTSATTNTPTTTPIINRLVNGPSDNSIVNYWRSDFTSKKAYPLSLPDVSVNLFATDFSYIQIHPNGFVSFETSTSTLTSPPSSISAVNVPVLAPFWADSILTRNSDISYGFYTINNIGNTAFAKIKNLLNNSTQVSRSASLEDFNPEIILIITWKNLQLTSNPNDLATFQLVLTISVSQEQTYGIFNYQSIQLSAQNSIVFIGFTDGKSYKSINSYSYNSDTQGRPGKVAQQMGNTNQVGSNVYDLNYYTNDLCNNWYLSKYLSPNYKIPDPSNREYIKCGPNLAAQKANPLFRQYNGPMWQSTTCFALKSTVFFGSQLQQFCCYNNDATGSLQTNGRDSGFYYDDKIISQIMSAGNACCKNKDWTSCRKFYTIYPPSRGASSKSANSWAGGDPNFITFDGQEYTFNGFGKFILTKSTDNLFEIQINTQILPNLNGSDMSGTFINAISVRDKFAPIVQIELIDYTLKNPYLILTVNNVQVTSFTRNMNYLNEFRCTNDISKSCVSVSQTSDMVQLIYNDGLTVSMSIFKTPINTYQSLSWIVFSVNLPDRSWTDLVGLMGNNDGNPANDIRSRSGLILAANTADEEAIYNSQLSWMVTDADTKMFNNLLSSSGRSSTDAGTKYSRITPENYRPTFVDLSAVPASIKNQCMNVQSCIVDSMISGVPSAGLDTLSRTASFQRASMLLSSSAPIVTFQNASLNIDWSLANTTLSLVAYVYSTVPVQIDFDIKNATVYTTKVVAVNDTFSIVTIAYTITPNEYPRFGIIATDDNNLVTTSYFSQIYICNCKKLDASNQCQYDRVQTFVNSQVTIVGCLCNQYYSGNLCDQVRNDCLPSNPCNLYSISNMTCRAYTLSEQKTFNQTYTCVGSCGSGFTRNDHQACLDIDECLSTSPAKCPASSACVNTVGSYACNCDEGLTYVNNSCQVINFCQTQYNTCDQQCTPVSKSFSCSCYYGYALNSTTNACDQSLNISGCSTLGCSQVCTYNNATNSAVCKCRKGYALNSDAKTCSDVNECSVKNGGCPATSTCVNLPGSFKCSCPAGTQFDIRKNTCFVCPANTYGFDCSQTCPASFNSIRCDPVKGLICNVGYTGSDCSQFTDPCTNVSLGANQECVVRGGQANVICTTGYSMDPDGTCKLTDNCLSGPCPQNSTCTSLFNNYTCSCPTGYSYDYPSKLCMEVNECLNVNLCPKNSYCVNTDASYVCVCENGYQNMNNDTKQPNCVDVDECALKLNNCNSTTELCRNLPGSFACSCQQGYVYIAENDMCKLSSSDLMKSTPSDRTGLVLVIVLPVVAVLILSIIAATILYCWCKMHSSKETYKEKPAGLSAIPGIITDNKEVDLIDFNSVQPDPVHNFKVKAANKPAAFDSHDSETTTTSRSIYRTNYPFQSDTNNLQDFFKSLENNVRSNQRTTIARPQSMLNDSSFSMPTGYYEKTTPYADYRRNKHNLDDIVDDLEDEDENTNVQNRASGYDPFANDDDMKDGIEVFNPLALIPRPKIQINPLKIFNLFGANKDDETST